MITQRAFADRVSTSESFEPSATARSAAATDHGPAAPRRHSTGILLVSLGAQTNPVAGIQRVAALAASGNVGLSVYLLDSAELINQKVLHGLDDTAASDRVNEQCLKISSKVNARAQASIHIARLSDFTSSEPFRDWFRRVSDTFANNSRFAHMCENQVYVNLQPRLRRLGARNRRHPIVSQLVDYILTEVAFKLFLLHGDSYDVEYGAGADMQLWRAVLNDEFQEFAPLPLRPEYISVAPEPVRPSALALDGVTFSYAESTPSRRSWILGSRLVNDQPKSERGLASITLSMSGTAAVLGPSGSFKTTLLKLIAGHLTQQRGSIFIGDRDVTAQASEQRHVATVFQDFALFPHLNGLNNVLEGARRLTEYSHEQRGWLALMHLRRLGVAHCADRFPNTMSGGEQQRVAIARALMSEPEVLLLDEPTAALDAIQRDELAKILKQFSATAPAMTTVIVSHDRDFVLEIADQLAVIDEGRVLAFGDKHQLVNNPPDRRVATIMGTHSVVSGRLDGNTFVADGDKPWTITISKPHSNLDGCRCDALVRRDGIVIAAIDPEESSDICIATMVDLVDQGSTTRYVFRLNSGQEVIAVSATKDVPAGLEVFDRVELRFVPEAVSLVAAA